jgi:hypothetical protein
MANTWIFAHKWKSETTHKVLEQRCVIFQTRSMDATKLTTCHAMGMSSRVHIDLLFKLRFLGHTIPLCKSTLNTFLTTRDISTNINEENFVHKLGSSFNKWGLRHLVDSNACKSEIWN